MRGSSLIVVRRHGQDGLPAPIPAGQGFSALHATPPRRQIKSFDWSTGAIALIAVAAGVFVYVREGQARFLQILIGDIGLATYMTPKVIAGCLIGTLVPFLLPREAVGRWVGSESGFLGLVVAFVGALVLPGSPLTIFPVASAFMMMGADVGAVVVYIAAWSLLGYQRALVWEFPFMGPDFVFWRILLSLPLPFVAGILARLLMRAYGNKGSKP